MMANEAELLDQIQEGPYYYYLVCLVVAGSSLQLLYGFENHYVIQQLFSKGYYYLSFSHYLMKVIQMYCLHRKPDVTIVPIFLKDLNYLMMYHQNHVY